MAITKLERFTREFIVCNFIFHCLNQISESTKRQNDLLLPTRSNIFAKILTLPECIICIMAVPGASTRKVFKLVR